MPDVVPMHVASIHVCYPRIPTKRRGIVDLPIGVLVVQHMAVMLDDKDLRSGGISNDWEIHRMETGELIVRKKIPINCAKRKKSKVLSDAAWNVASKLQQLFRKERGCDWVGMVSHAGGLHLFNLKIAGYKDVKKTT